MISCSTEVDVDSAIHSNSTTVRDIIALMKRTELTILLLILTLAAGFRFWNLHDTPPGLYPDEAMNGNNALHAIDSGEYKLFYPENNGREGLFINLQALSIKLQGNTPFALRSVSALIGVLTVLGTYLLTRRLFDDWHLAAMAALLMATGFWHVNFSRIGFRAIMSPFMAVWGFYYLYKGIETHRVWHWGLAGLFFGLGVHTYLAFRLMPLSILTVIIAYVWSLKVVFAHRKYAFSRQQVFGGIAAMAAVAVLVILPMVKYFIDHPEDFSGRVSQVSVLGTDAPIQNATRNFVQTLGMFVVHGDSNWRHNLSGEPLLFWPIAAFFAVGLAHSIWRVGRSLRQRRHPGVVQTLILSWFFVGLLPGIISNEGIPHALRVLTSAPPAYILAAIGMHWCYTWLLKRYAMHDAHPICLPGPRGHRWCTTHGAFVVGFTAIAFLFAMTVAEGNRYFVRWAQSPETAGAFNAPYLKIAERLNALPPATLKYVVVRAGGVAIFPPGRTDPASAVAMPAQTVMYLTDSWSIKKQEARNIFYLTPEQYAKKRLPREAFVIQLEP
jgi:4-amino-4-deoxy-L-arabinose transferase-like glycosyltransferase